MSTSTRRPRRMVLGLALALAALLATAGSVLAVRKTSNPGTVFGCDGGVCATAQFLASWDVVQGHSEGQHYWTVTNMWPSVVLGNARAAAAQLGVKPMAGLRVEALNSSGAVVGRFSWSSSACGSFAIGTNDLYYGGCDTYTELPLSAVKLRFDLKVEVPAKFGAGLSKTWVANLT